MVAAATEARELRHQAEARYIGWRDALRTNGLLSAQQSDELLNLANVVAREVEWLEFLSLREDPVQGRAGAAIAWEQALTRLGLHPLPYNNISLRALGKKP